jgi:hypothetical protein
MILMLNIVQHSALIAFYIICLLWIIFLLRKTNAKKPFNALKRIFMEKNRLMRSKILTHLNSLKALILKRSKRASRLERV